MRPAALVDQAHRVDGGETTADPDRRQRGGCTLPGLAKNVSQMSTAEAVIPKTSDLATQTSFMASTIWVEPLRASSNNISVLSR